MSDRFEMTEFPKKDAVPMNDGSNKLTDALADNMGNIISLAKDIVDIQRMRVQSQTLLDKMEEDRAMLRDEAEAYVNKKNADTNQIIGKMQIAREILKDFYNQKNTAGVSAEEFSAVIKAIFENVPD